MKLHVIYIYPPDTDDENNFFGVFDSKEKYLQALKEFGKEIEFDFEEGTYDVTETELNKIWN